MALGQTLFAIKNVDIKRQALDSAATVYTAKKGESIGTVQDYLPPNSSRKNGYYVFRDKNGNSYYTVHDNSLYDKKFDFLGTDPGNNTNGSTPKMSRTTAIVAVLAILAFFWLLMPKKGK